MDNQFDRLIFLSSDPVKARALYEQLQAATIEEFKRRLVAHNLLAADVADRLGSTDKTTGRGYDNKALHLMR
jgi:hypothetical protein